MSDLENNYVRASIISLKGTELNTRVSFGNRAREIFGVPDAVLGIDYVDIYGNEVDDEKAVSFDLDEARTILDTLEDVILTELSMDGVIS